MVSSVTRADRCPVASVDLVAYLARYPATCPSVRSPVADGDRPGRRHLFAPQAIGQPRRLVGWGSVVNRTPGVAASDRVLEDRGVQFGRRRDDRVRVGGVDAVEADDGVEVHDAAALHLGDLPVRHADGLRVDAAGLDQTPELAGDGDCRCGATVRRRAGSRRPGPCSRSSPGTTVYRGTSRRRGEGACRSCRTPCRHRSIFAAADGTAAARPVLLVRRVWTGPKPGAVNVANTAGWVATVSGMPRPPTSPARMSWYASRRYVSAQDGQTVVRRLPHGL